LLTIIINTVLYIYLTNIICIKHDVLNMSTVKPFINTEPKDVTVHTGQTAEFECKVGGDPKPNIYWEREGNKMPYGRAQILDNKSLRIINVIAQDEGLYICNAENDVGSEKAKASLTVHCMYIDQHFIYR